MSDSPLPPPTPHPPFYCQSKSPQKFKFGNTMKTFSPIPLWKKIKLQKLQYNSIPYSYIFLLKLCSNRLDANWHCQKLGSQPQQTWLLIIFNLLNCLHLPISLWVENTTTLQVIMTMLVLCNRKWVIL